jgi:hypothetical protein
MTWATDLRKTLVNIAACSLANSKKLKWEIMSVKEGGLYRCQIAGRGTVIVKVLQPLLQLRTLIKITADQAN